MGRKRKKKDDGRKMKGRKLWRRKSMVEDRTKSFPRDGK